MALHWSFRVATATAELLRQLGRTPANGKMFSKDGVKAAQRELRRAGLLVERGTDSGYSRLQDDARAALYRELLDDTPADELLRAMLRAESTQPGARAYGFGLWDPSATVAIVRLELLCGANPARIEELQARASAAHDWASVLSAAVFEAFDGALFERINPTWRSRLAAYGLAELCASWNADLLPLRDWALRKWETEPGALSEALRLQIAEMLLLQGEGARSLALLAGIDSGAADALRAAGLVQQGRFVEAQSGFEAGFKKLHSQLGTRKNLMPGRVAWLYPLALLGQQTPKALELARKFCVGESGRRDPAPYDDWGAWAHVVAVRLGDRSLDPEALRLRSRPGYACGWSVLWRCLVRAWLGA